jgi:hypothetical protein
MLLDRNAQFDDTYPGLIVISSSQINRQLTVSAISTQASAGFMILLVRFEVHFPVIGALIRECACMAGTHQSRKWFNPHA